MGGFALLAFGSIGLVWGQEELTPTPVDSSSSAVLDQADEVLKEVSRLAGLPPKTPVKKELKSRDFFSRYFLDLLQQQYPPEKKAALEKAYVFFGFLAPGTDLVESTQASMLKNVQGLYDPEAKTLYLADWVGDDLQATVLAHELTHALQDQYFDLRVYVNQERDASMDYQFAHDSVMEGQAVAIALNYTLRDKGKDFTQLANIADVTRLSNKLDESGQRAFGRKTVLPDVADFPYVYGTAFLQKYVEVYGWQGMKYLFEHPPTSTHQILHPETFFPRRRNPIRVAVEDLSRGALKGRSRIWGDSLGEYGLFLVLGQSIPTEQAWGAVSGWRGDRYQLYEEAKSGNLTGVGYAIFENEVSAGKFFDAAKSMLLLKYHVDPAGSPKSDPFRLSLGGTGLEVFAERRGKRVVLIEGTRTAETTKVRTALWEMKRGAKKIRAETSE